MIRLRAMARRQSRKTLAVAAMVLVSLILAWAHSGPGGHEMAGDEMGAAITACVAVLQGGTALLLGLGFVALVRRARPSLTPLPSPSTFDLPGRPDGPARPRAGPDLLQVFLS